MRRMRSRPSGWTRRTSHPLFPEVLLVLCRLAGFASAYVFHPLGSGHVEDDRYRESEYALVAKHETEQ